MWPADERIDLRVNLIVEEVTKELLPAIANRDLVETADAIVDSIYVLIGAALEFGIPVAEVWAAVQSANMAKAVEQPNGTFKVIKRADSKILKPEGWTPPDVKAILVAHGWKG
jgi:predicted HAD superfamily Cof-like phosphohydrolase